MGVDDALAQRAFALVDAGDLAGAMAAARSAVAHDPGAAEAHVALGWTLELLGEEHLREAAAAYERALALDPGALWAKEGLANVLRRLGRPAEADALAAEVIAETAAIPHPDPETLELRGWCAFQLGRAAEAERDFRTALEADPDLVSVRLDLALVLLCTGRHPEALAAYGTAIETARRLGDRRGVLAIALDDLEQALASRPELAATSAAATARRLLSGASTGTASAPMSEV